MYLITGATGNVGSQVLAQLRRQGHAARAFSRQPVGPESVRGDFDEPATLADALEGVKGVFLMDVGPDVPRFQRLAEVLGHTRVVFLSTMLADRQDSRIGALHKAKEEALGQAGVDFVAVRPGGFMSNALQWRNQLPVVTNPMGQGRYAPIAPEDIASVVTALLTGPEFSQRVFPLSGPELVTVPQQVEILAEVLERPLECREVTVEEAVRDLQARGLPPEMAQAVGQSYQNVRDGLAISIQDTVERVSGRPPITFAQWARGNAHRFQ